MKILAPVRSIDEVDALAEAGADEIYCGVLTNEWKTRYSSAGAPNRVERSSGNLKNFTELEKLVILSHDAGLQVFFTLNGLLSAEQYNGLLRKEAMDAIDSGVDGIIVADPGIIRFLQSLNPGIELHLSTGGTVFNREALLFYKDLGITRIVLPRSLGLSNMVDLAKEVPDIYLEAIIMNGGCTNEDGFCTFHHGLDDEKIGQSVASSKAGEVITEVIDRFPERFRNAIMGKIVSGITKNACTLPAGIDVLRNDYDSAVPAENVKERLKRLRSDGWRHMQVCGACALYDFMRSGIGSVKIVGRSMGRKKKTRDVKYIRYLISVLEGDEISFDEFQSLAIKTYREIYGSSCGTNCYYPSEAHT